MLITGASRGIGAATARLTAGRGYAVCVNYLRNGVAAQKVVTDIEQNGGKAVAVAANIAVEQEVVTLFERLDDSLGRVTALVNNAGILDLQMRVEEMSEAIRRMSTASNPGCRYNVVANPGK